MAAKSISGRRDAGSEANAAARMARRVGEWTRRDCEAFAEGEALVFIEGHDDAILGIAEVDGEMRVVYDRGAIIAKLIRRDGMDRQGAEEFFEYNIAGAQLGSRMPLFADMV